MKQKRTSGGRLSTLRPVLCAAVLMAVCLLFSGIAEANSKKPAYRRPSVDRKRRDIILYVGDSRTWFYDLHHVKDKRDGLIYRDGASIGELRYNKNYSRCGQLGKYLRDALKTYPNAKIVLNFGCNGCSRVSSNAKRVVKEYQKWKRAYPDRQFYVASIFPAADRKPYSRGNMHYMNRALKKNFPDKYIDAGEYLERRGLDQPRKDGRGFQKKRGGYDLKHYSRYASKAVKKYIRSVVMAAG